MPFELFKVRFKTEELAKEFAEYVEREWPEDYVRVVEVSEKSVVIEAYDQGAYDFVIWCFVAKKTGKPIFARTKWWVKQTP